MSIRQSFHSHKNGKFGKCDNSVAFAQQTRPYYAVKAPLLQCDLGAFAVR